MVVCARTGQWTVGAVQCVCTVCVCVCVCVWYRHGQAYLSRKGIRVPNRDPGLDRCDHSRVHGPFDVPRDRNTVAPSCLVHDATTGKFLLGDVDSKRVWLSVREDMAREWGRRLRGPREHDRVEVPDPGRVVGVDDIDLVCV